MRLWLQLQDGAASNHWFLLQNPKWEELVWVCSLCNTKFTLSKSPGYLIFEDCGRARYYVQGAVLE